jgi:hypothetical protein
VLRAMALMGDAETSSFPSRNGILISKRTKLLECVDPGKSYNRSSRSLRISFIGIYCLIRRRLESSNPESSSQESLHVAPLGLGTVAPSVDSPPRAEESQPMADNGIRGRSPSLPVNWSRLALIGKGLWVALEWPILRTSGFFPFAAVVRAGKITLLSRARHGRERTRS